MREWSQKARDYTAKTEEGAVYEQQCRGGRSPPRHCCSYAAPSEVLSRIIPSFEAPFAALSLLSPRQKFTLNAREVQVFDVLMQLLNLANTSSIHSSSGNTEIGKGQPINSCLVALGHSEIAATGDH